MTDHNAIILGIIKARPDFASAISQYDLADECMRRSSEHMSARAVRRVIEDLIVEGYPIISTPHSPGGYCWGNNNEEVLECYKRLRKKGIKTLVRARKVYRNCKAERDRRQEMEQLEMFQLERVG